MRNELGALPGLRLRMVLRFDGRLLGPFKASEIAFWCDKAKGDKEMIFVPLAHGERW